MNPFVQGIDSCQVRRGFSRAAGSYEALAQLPREIGARMLERLDYVKISPARVLDVGCGTGTILTALGERYRQSQLIGADFCLPMLQAGQRSRRSLRWLLPFLQGRRAALIAADASALPLATGSVELVWSNLLLHWLNDPLSALREMHRVLNVGGLLMFSAFGPDTLKELRDSFSDGFAHTLRFTDMHDYGDMLVDCGFADPVMDSERVTVTYATLDDLFRELRQSGSTCALTARQRGLTGRAVWQTMSARYTALAQAGRIPASLEIVYGHAWKAAPAKTADGRAIIRFERGVSHPATPPAVGATPSGPPVDFSP